MVRVVIKEFTKDPSINDKYYYHQMEFISEGIKREGENLSYPTAVGSKTGDSSPSINNIIPRGENYVNNAENNQKSVENAPFNPEFKEKQRKRYKTIIESDLVSKEAKIVAKELMGVDTYVPESNVNQLRKIIP